MSFAEYLRYLLLLLFLPNSLKTMEWRMLRLLNKDRKKNGLLPVRMQSDLRTVARKHSMDMAKKDYFDHVNLKAQSPADRLKLSGVTDVTSGENLAKIGGFKNPAQHAEQGLMNSPGHRANILNKNYNVVGIGIVRDSSGVYYFTQNFAKRDLLFKRYLPSKTRMRKGLALRGTAVPGIKNILCRVRFVRSDAIRFEQVVHLQDRNFSFTLPFSEPGIHEILLYSQSEKTEEFMLTNSFEIRVVKGLFF